MDQRQGHWDKNTSRNYWPGNGIRINQDGTYKVCTGGPVETSNGTVVFKNILVDNEFYVRQTVNIIFKVKFPDIFTICHV